MNWQMWLGIGFWWVTDLLLIGYALYLVRKFCLFALDYLDLGRVSKYDK
mgnify:FL=1